MGLEGRGGSLLGHGSFDAVPLAAMLARGAFAKVVILALGGLLMLVGALRLLGLFPNLLGRRRINPAVPGVIFLLVGAALVVIGILR